MFFLFNMKKIMIVVLVLSVLFLVGCAKEPIVKESNFGEECGKDEFERDECCERVMSEKSIVLPACVGKWKWNGELNSCVYDCGFKRLINNFEECVAAGHPVMESYPEQCSDGLRSFTRELRDDEMIETKKPRILTEKECESIGRVVDSDCEDGETSIGVVIVNYTYDICCNHADYFPSLE